MIWCWNGLVVSGLVRQKLAVSGSEILGTCSFLFLPQVKKRGCSHLISISCMLNESRCFFIKSTKYINVNTRHIKYILVIIIFVIKYAFYFVLTSTIRYIFNWTSINWRRFFDIWYFFQISFFKWPSRKVVQMSLQ